MPARLLRKSSKRLRKYRPFASVAKLALSLPCLRAGGKDMSRQEVAKFVVVAALLVSAAAVGALLLGTDADLWVFRRAAAQATAQDRSDLLAADALRVAICGSSAPLPSPARAKACVAVFAGGSFYLVDVGPESVENLVQWGIPLAKIKGVLLTHFHSDHIGDLGELNLQTWAQGRPEPLAVYGGPGVEDVVDGFNRAYRHDQGYRTAHHTERLMPPATWPLAARPLTPDCTDPCSGSPMTVLDERGLRITAIAVNHAPVAPAYAYRFDYRGRSVFVSGDLKYSPSLAAAADNVDVIVMEAIARPMVKALSDGAAAAGRDRQAAILHDIQDYHIDPAEAAEVANAAGAKLLLLYHLLPAPDTFIARRLFASDLNRARNGRWQLADDATLITLPLGSGDVRPGRIAN
jgi:ribonuclease Z